MTLEKTMPVLKYDRVNNELLENPNYWYAEKIFKTIKLSFIIKVVLKTHGKLIYSEST